jgi:hypothetical protein
MSKKRTRKRSSGDQQQAKTKPAKEEKTSPAEPQSPDYGGLPDIDLKKNLGCG